MNRYFIHIILFLFFIAGILTIIFFNGTGDSGDSLQHYLFSRYAPNHPELYFHHWAKPLFVLISSPFAQFGFNGIKVFNLIVTTLAIYFTYKTSVALKVKNAILVALIMIFSSQYYVLTFSGLTEPLFALFLIMGIYYAVKEKYYLSSIIISFLPFIRSEGLILVGVFAFYLLIKKKWKPFLLLSTGHIIYSFAGYFVHHDLLWVFNKIPYVSLDSKYGEGELFHYTRKLLYIVGIPVYMLSGLGIICFVYRWIRKKSKIFSPESILIFVGFFAFLTAHSIFWYFGLFDSMGLSRVLIGIVPIIAIIALYGYNFLTEYFLPQKKWYKYVLQLTLIAYLLIFPFTANNAAINWKKDMMLRPDQILLQDADIYLSENNITSQKYIYSHPYISVLLELDCFEPKESLLLNKNTLSTLDNNEIIIWDNWFSVVEGGIEESYLNNFPSLQKMKLFSSDSLSNKASKIIIYKYKKEAMSK